jgi:hypothetical protein
MVARIRARYKDSSLGFLRFVASKALWGLCLELDRERVYNQASRDNLSHIHWLTSNIFDKVKSDPELALLEEYPPDNPASALKLGKALATQRHMYSKLARVGEMLKSVAVRDGRDAIQQGRDAIMMAKEAALEVYEYFVPEFEKALHADP